MEDLCRKTEDVIKFGSWRSDEPKTKIPLNTTVANVLRRQKVRFKKINIKPQLRTDEDMCHA